MLTKVEAVSPRGDTLALPLQDLTAGYLVKEIEGLEPVKATIVSSTFANLDGSQYQNSRRENRNIRLRLGLVPDFAVSSVQELRNRLYGYFMPKTFVTLKFYMDEIHFVTISGRVESLETPLFAKEPEVVISMLCFDPDFVAPVTKTITGSTVSSIGGDLPVVYPGTVEAGFVLRLTTPRALTELVIYNRPPGGDFQIFEFNALLSAGDGLEISTVSGAKRVMLTRAGAQTSVLYGVSTTATWLNFWPGTNSLRVQTEGEAIPFTIDYVARYGGL